MEVIRDGKRLWLRDATEADARLLYDWRNEETARSNSFSKDEIDYATHEAWFRASLDNADRQIFIMMEDDVPVGMMRLDYEGGRGVISTSVDVTRRGRGYGTVLALLMEEKARTDEVCGDIIAGNEACVRAYAAAGYDVIPQGDTVHVRKILDRKGVV